MFELVSMINTFLEESNISVSSNDSSLSFGVTYFCDTRGNCCEKSIQTKRGNCGNRVAIIFSKIKVINRFLSIKLKGLIRAKALNQIKYIRLLASEFKSIEVNLDIIILCSVLHQTLIGEELFSEIIFSIKRISKLIQANSKVMRLSIYEIINGRFIHLSFFGFSKKFINYFNNISEFYLEHRSFINMVHDYLELRSLMAPHNNSIRGLFKHLGFTNQRSKGLEHFLSHNSICHQTILYWAKFYVDRYLVIESLPCTFRKPFIDDNNVFYIKTNYLINKKSAIFVSAEFVKNMQYSNIHNLQKYVFQNNSSFYSTNFWFHGTDVISALNIARNGVILSKAKYYNDFSSSEGFYVTDNIRYAFLWSTSFKNCSINSAIIVFRVKNKSIFSNCRSLQFRNNNFFHKQVVSFFRNKECHNRANIPKSKGRFFKRLDFIYGPLSFDNNAIQQDCPALLDDECFQDPYQTTNRKQTFQLCLKNYSIADKFYNRGLNIYKIIFFTQQVK